MDLLIKLPKALLTLTLFWHLPYAQEPSIPLLTDQELRLENRMMRSLVIPLVGDYYKEHGKLPKDLGDLRDSIDLTKGLDENLHLGPVGERYAILPKPVPYLDGDELIVIALRPVRLEKRPGVYETGHLAGYYSERRGNTGRAFIPESELEKYLAPLSGQSLRPMGPPLPPTRRIPESRDFSYMDRRLAEDPLPPLPPRVRTAPVPAQTEYSPSSNSRSESAVPNRHHKLLIAATALALLSLCAKIWMRRKRR